MINTKTALYSDDVAKLQQTERWKSFHQDLLEPRFYPDPTMLRNSLPNLTRDDIELMKNLTSNKATIRVLAPYLQIMRKKIIEAVTKNPSVRSPRGVDTKATVLHVDKKVQQPIASVAPELSERVEMIVSIHETADVLQWLLSAKTAVSYLVNQERKEIFQSPRHVESSTGNLSWKIESGTTMAAYAAYTREHVVSNNVSADLRYPLGLGFPGSIAKFAVCVPVNTPDNCVVAVYEFTRNAYDKPFDKKDVQLVLAVTAWMGVAIQQNNMYTSVTRQQELTNYLTELTAHYHAGSSSLTKTLSDIVIFARDTIGAEKCNLFSVSKENKHTYALEEYDQGVENARYVYKRRTKKFVTKGESLLGKVLESKEAMKTHKDISEICEDVAVAPVRSVLCVPILSNKKTIGVIQLTNKKAATTFDQLDVDTLQIFATFCALNMAHVNVHDKLSRSELLNRVTQEMLFHHIKPCSHDQRAVTNYSADDLPDQFFTFSWYPSPDDTLTLVELTINMFHAVLGTSFMALNNVPRFVLTVNKCYRPNPYHNYVHAFAVAHTMANVISRYEPVFTGLERKGLMVAALCHDVDHRGYNNNFLQMTQHYLVSLYDSSPLENHHFAVTKMIIHQCCMFKYFRTAIYNELLTEIYEAIIATDLSLYFHRRLELMKIADEKTFTFVNPDHRRLVKDLLMTASDLSGQTKPLVTCQKITEDVYEEFYQQGDVEKKMGYIPLPSMDRTKRALIAENQVQFLTVVVLPCVETVASIFTMLGPMVSEAKKLLHQWQELVKLKEDSVWKPRQSLPVRTSL